MLRDRLPAAVLALAGILVLPGSARPEPPSEAAVCVEALARSEGEPLAALARAESDRWLRARRAERTARKLMRQTVGMGESPRSLHAAAEVDRLADLHSAAVDEAFTLCLCRERRGDPYREDCASLYRPWRRPVR